MARLIGFTYGELRGKIGGNVFSRNKAGAYVRARVTPVNPQTVRQQTARYNFGNMSIQFQNLSAAVKDCWEEFARTHFNPLKGNSTGIYSGGNAFVALRQSARQGNNYRVAPTGTATGGALTIVSVPYSEMEEPPTTPSSATLKDVDGVSYEFAITINEVDASGKVDFSVTLPSQPIGSEIMINKFISAESDTFGVSFYASNPLKFEGAKPNTALKINFADTGVLNSIKQGVEDLDITKVNSFIVEPNIDKANTRDFPCGGDWILVTPVLRFNKGQQKLMAPQYVLVNDVQP